MLNSLVGVVLGTNVAFLSRAERSTVLIRKVLVSEGVDEGAMDSFHAHLVRMATSTSAGANPELAAIAPRAMNHSMLTANIYKRDRAAQAVAVAPGMATTVTKASGDDPVLSRKSKDSNSGPKRPSALPQAVGEICLEQGEVYVYR